MNRFFLTLLVLLASLRMMSAGWHDVPLQSQITHVQPMTGLVLWEDLPIASIPLMGRAMPWSSPICLRAGW